MAKTFRNLTPAQERAFGLITSNEHPWGSTPKTIQALLDKGLITKSHKTIYGKGNTAIDRIPMIVDTYQVADISIHYEWCEWCSEQPEANN